MSGPRGNSSMPQLILTHETRSAFLDAELTARLLDFAISAEERYEPTQLYGGIVNPETRLSLGIHDFKPLKTELKTLIAPLVPAFAASLKLSAFDFHRLELELVAHNDGAFFKRHIDTATREGAATRVISAVYYFHATPKAFSGGALRLHALGSSSGPPQYLDIEPEHNLLVTFPSWMPHEVLPVSCPSRRFADSRFAINIWVHRKLPVAPAPA